MIFSGHDSERPESSVALRQELLSPSIVLRQRVTRCHEEDGFQQDKAGVHKTHMPKCPEIDSIGHVCNARGNEHVGVKLVVPVMNLDEQTECLNAGGKP